MAVTISRLYDRYADAERAVSQLEAAGIPQSDISIVANNSDEWYNSGKKDRDRDGVDDRAESAGKGAGIGAGIGGTAGLLAGLGLLAIPGLGPVVAAGWLAATAVGAAAGAAAVAACSRVALAILMNCQYPVPPVVPTPKRAATGRPPQRRQSC